MRIVFVVQLHFFLLGSVNVGRNVVTVVKGFALIGHTAGFAMIQDANFEF